MDNEERTDEYSQEEFLISDLVTIMYKSYKSYLMYKIADLNITPGQIPFILELLHSKNASQDDLSNKLFLTRGATAKTLRKLDDEKIVERKTAVNNRRKYNVYLTEKGKEAALEIEKIDKSWEELIISHLNDSLDSENSEFGDKEKIIKFLRSLAKSSIESLSEEMEKIENSDSPEDNCGMPPFGEFPFRGHHFRGPGPYGNFFRTSGCFSRSTRRKP